MKTAKKAMLLTLCALVLVAATVMGTLAYLTSTDEVVNTFTVGKVAIEMDEAKVDEKGQAIEDADRVKANTYKLMPGVDVDKDPTVTVLAGSEPCYVRVLVTMTNMDAVKALSNLNVAPSMTGVSDKWDLAGVTQDAEHNCFVYEFRYDGVVPASQEAQVLEPVFTAVKVPGALTNEQLKTLAGLKINAVAQAIQADGFKDAEAAWTAFPQN